MTNWDSRFNHRPYAIGHTRYPLFLLLLFLAGCSLLQSHEELDEPVKLIAVFPVQRAEPAGASATEGTPRLAPGAERVITAQIYRVMASSPEWRFVPDLTVTQALAKLNRTGGMETQARELGQAVGADAVLVGTVSRYIERVGGEYGAERPASVAFNLQLLSVKTGKVLWQGSFDQTQESLSSNLLNWWQFWKGGPRWFTAQEFSNIAVESVLGELKARIGP